MIVALLIADSLVSVFCTRAVMLKNASQQPQNNGEAKVEKRLLPGETTHRLSASAETVMVDSFLQKPDEMLFMDDSVHRVSEEDADALYRVILNMMESYPGDILRSTYVPGATEEDFRQYGALEFRFQKYYSYSYQMEERVLSGTEDALWVFFYKGYPCLVPGAERKGNRPLLRARKPVSHGCRPKAEA